jgi:hypothetical protein
MIAQRPGAAAALATLVSLIAAAAAVDSPTQRTADARLAS